MSELGLHAQGQWMPTGTLRSQMRNTSKNAIFGKYVRRHLVSVEHRSFGLVHGKGVFYKCETSLGCKLQYKHLCSQRKKRSELLPTLPTAMFAWPRKVKGNECTATFGGVVLLLGRRARARARAARRRGLECQVGAGAGPISEPRVSVCVRAGATERSRSAGSRERHTPPARPRV